MCFVPFNERRVTPSSDGTNYDDDGDGDDDVDGDGGDATCPLASSASDPSTVLGPLRRESAGSIPKYTEYTRIYRVYWGIQRVPGSEFEEGASSQTAHLPLNSLQPKYCVSIWSRGMFIRIRFPQLGYIFSN